MSLARVQMSLGRAFESGQVALSRALARRALADRHRLRRFAPTRAVPPRADARRVMMMMVMMIVLLDFTFCYGLACTHSTTAASSHASAARASRAARLPPPPTTLSRGLSSASMPGGSDARARIAVVSPRGEGAAADDGDARGHLRREVTIVRDQDERVKVPQSFLEVLARRGRVVRRLVEEEEVGGREQHPSEAERRAPPSRGRCCASRPRPRRFIAA